MNKYYLLKDGVFKEGAEFLFSNEDVLLPYNKGDKIFYNDYDNEYTIIHIDYYLEDCRFNNTKGRFKHRKIYLRAVK